MQVQPWVHPVQPTWPWSARVPLQGEGACRGHVHRPMQHPVRGTFLTSAQSPPPDLTIAIHHVSLMYACSYVIIFTAQIIISLCLFSVYLAQQGLQPQSISSALSTAGLDDKSYSGHSFRIGAATAAAAAGIPDHLIKMLGRWESSAYQLYVRTPHQAFADISRRMVA